MARKTPIASAEEWFRFHGPFYPCGHPRTLENSYSSARVNHWFRCKTCVGQKAKARIQSIKHTEKYKRYNNDSAKRLNAQARAEMISAYGGSCQCCGELEPRFLTLEHKNGGGNQERKLYGGGKNTGSASQRIIRRLRREGWPKENYTVLCANCNMASKWGTCPHQRIFTSLLTPESRSHSSSSDLKRRSPSLMRVIIQRSDWSDCASWRERANPTPISAADLRAKDSSLVWSD